MVQVSNTSTQRRDNNHPSNNYADIVTTSVISSGIVIIVVLAVVGFALMFVGVRRKRAALLQHDYDDMYPVPQLAQSIKDQQQINTIDGRQEHSIDVFNTPPFANEGEPADSNSLYATIPDTEADVCVRMEENSAYQPSTNFVFATNPAYGTNIGTAPEIETEENTAYHCDISYDC